MPNEYLISPHQLTAMLQKNKMVILDCRGPTAYAESHIEGAIPLSVDYWLKEGGARGMHMLMAQPFELLMESLGISRETSVVLYDDLQGKAAARVWWVMKYYGHNDVCILDGGWPHWLINKFPVSSASVSVARKGKYIPVIQSDLKIDIDELLANRDAFQIIDARSWQEYTGADAHGNPRPGRIPEAVHLEWSDLVSSTPDKAFKSPEKLAALISAKHLDPNKPTVIYCQAGIRAAHVAFVLTMLGFDKVRVFDGAMCEWSRRPDAPVVMGD